MICTFCKNNLDDLNNIPNVSKNTFSVYSIYCHPCKAHYKLNNQDQILFTILEYKNCRLLFFQEQKNECLLQIGTKTYAELNYNTIYLPIQEIYQKIDNLLPFL